MASSFRSRAFRTIERGFAFVGVLTVGGGCAAYYSIRKFTEGLQDGKGNILKDRAFGKQLPNEFVLEFDLQRYEVVESATRQPFDFLYNNGVRPLGLKSIVKGIRNAGKDDRVKGLVAIGGNGTGQMAQIQEIRNAVHKFGKDKEGKVPSIFYTDSFGEGNNAMMLYYLASSFNEVVVQPTGLICTFGLSVTTPFVRGVLDRLKIRPYFKTREEYKNAANMYTEEAYTDPHREAFEKLLDCMSDQIVKAAAEARGLTPEEVWSAINSAPLTMKEAMTGKLVDKAMYRDEVLEMLQKPAGKEEIPRVSLKDYVKALEKEENAKLGKQWSRPFAGQGNGAGGGGPEIAVLTATGGITTGWEKPNPRAPGIQSGRFVHELQKVKANQDVKAVVIRVDSPGGSAIASDAIRREMDLLRKAGKKVVVSMGNIAASGGYYISTGADKIVAQPGTITGSIGVLTGKFGVRELLEDWGVNPETISRGDNADILSPFTGLDERQAGVIDKLLDDIYDHFIQQVCDARGMSTDQVRELAKGRVWSGVDALEIGLVDELGGFTEAVELARKEANLIGEDAQVVEYPRKKAPLIMLIEALSDKDDLGLDVKPNSKTLLASVFAGVGGQQNVCSLGCLEQVLGELLVGKESVQMLSMDAICIQKAMEM